MYFSDVNINNYIKSYLEEALRELGIENYAFAIINKKNTAEISIISNVKEWFEFYTKNTLQHIDPIVIKALNTIVPFPWDENIMINIGLKLPKIFDMVKKYSITTGCTFMVHDYKNNLALLTLMDDCFSSKEFGNLFKNNKDKLQGLLITTHDKLMTLYTDNQSKELKENKTMFSVRENEVLYWSSLGKTYQETAMILGIKLSTVKFHMGNIVKKLGVMNAKHAIRLGVEFGLIKSDTTQRKG